jgi:hypothetical protein
MRPYMTELVLPQRLASPPLGNLRAVGFVRLDLAELERLGPPNREDEPVDEWLRQRGAPPGPTRDWWFRARCGLEFVLLHDVILKGVAVLADETTELDHVLAHLPLEVEVERFRPEPEEAKRRAGLGGWVVLRQADGGARFDVATFSRETSARCYAQLLEDRRHKQSYYVEARGVIPPPPPREAGPQAWALIRIDDNGNRFELKRGPSRAHLEFLAEQFNREPRHKQTYFVERGESAPPASAPGMGPFEAR